jgi:CheY-like chemotaxis protein
MKTNQTNDLAMEMPSASPLAAELEKATMKFTPSDHVAETTQAQLRRQFRTGLNDILGAAKLLELQATETERENIQQILTTGRELLALIDEKPPVSGSDVLTGQSLPSESTSAQCHVLYVEDHDANFRLVGRILQRLPEVNLIRADRGEIAAPLARQYHPRLILLDLNLPDIPGTEVFQRMRAQPETQSTPIVVISADATPSQIERLLAMGARNYLTKPFNLQRFLAVVEEILEEEAKLS